MTIESTRPSGSPEYSKHCWTVSSAPCSSAIVLFCALTNVKTSPALVKESTSLPIKHLPAVAYSKLPTPAGIKVADSTKSLISALKVPVLGAGACALSLLASFKGSLPVSVATPLDTSN